MALSVEAGRPVECDRSGTFADGMAVRVAVPLAVEELVRAGHALRPGLRARDRGGRGRASRGRASAWRARAAPRWRRSDEVEPPDGPIVLIVTGHNIDDDLHRRAVEEPQTFPA